jgi:1,5-anhydro-D-fructose reductase (1,5-anhydro-D-mannitol-forming)
MRDTIRWGIIGCGDVCEVKTGPAFYKVPGSRLVAVMRRDGALAADFARRHGVPRSYDDARALVNDPEVDAVYVATPPGAHLDGAMLALAVGKPAYVEKPMARNTAECDAMIAAFTRAGLKLFVSYYRRALPRFVTAKELIDKGAIGRVTGIVYRFAATGHGGTGVLPGQKTPPLTWRVQPETSGGGLFLDIGAHALDLLDFYFGALEGVHGHAARLNTPGDVEDTVALTFRTAHGAPGVVTMNFASAVKEDLMEITGTGGRISHSVFGNEPVKLETPRGVESFDRPNPPHIGQPLVQSAVDELLGRGTCPSTGETARRTTAVIDRVLADYYGGREDEFWKRVATWPGRHAHLNP